MLRELIARYRARRRERLALAVTLDAATDRAGRGAAYLDAADPGWPNRLDPATLELADGAHCVLGQLHGGFRRGLVRARVLDLSSAPLASLSPVDLGFQARTDLGAEIEALDYAYLNRAWRAEVQRRRDGSEQASPPRRHRNATPHLTP
ncbi:MAG: hypothetical protein R3362_03830 [Rhodothermales bacterium]|nr:hypothetical protein [Rhodothermales bacterium]